MTPEQLAREFRRELLDKDSQAAGRLVQAYGISWQRIKRDLDVLLAQIAVARKNGIPITKTWLDKEGRLRLLLDQIAIQIKQFEDVADFTILNGQSEAVRDAIRHAEALTLASVTPDKLAQIAITWNRVPAEALSHLVGFLGDGTPLRKALSSLSAESLKKVSDGLYSGVAAGLNPRQIASTIRDALGDDLTRALAISRTETLRAYRSAARENYQANKDVVNAWIWHSALGTRTCAVCWAMHGTVHPLEEEFASHVNCRCSQIPVVDPTLGIEQQPIETGESRFKKLTDSAQKAILGPTRYELYKAGKLTLSEVVDYQVDKDWGPTRTLKPVKHLVFSNSMGTPSNPRLISNLTGTAEFREAFVFEDNKVSNNRIRYGIDAVDKYLNLPTMRRLPVRKILKSEPYTGRFVPVAYGGPVMLIKRNAKQIEFTTVHEIGHLLELDLIHDNAGDLSQVLHNPVFKKWFDAVVSSDHVNQLTDVYFMASNTGDIYWIAQMDYRLKPWELWARSFAQWIATRTNDPLLLKQLSQIRDALRNAKLPPYQWEDNDFEPIAKEIDDIMKQVGYLPKHEI